MVDPVLGAELAREYTENRTGVLTSPLADFLGWEKLPEPFRSNLSQATRNGLTKYPSDWPELEYEINQAIQPMSPKVKKGYGNVLTVLVAPQSRGTVTLKSNSTTDLPIIDPRLMAEKADQELAVQGFKRARQVASQSSILPVIVGEEFDPGPAVQTDERILRYLQLTAYQNWHASCTCE